MSTNTTNNFLLHLEEHLRDLSSQARLKHSSSAEKHQQASKKGYNYLSILKEASERALLTLRALMRANDSNYQSQDLLRPFLLACNYGEAPLQLVQISLTAIQLLLSFDAVVNEDSVQIIHVLAIQASSRNAGSHCDEATCLKILQTCTMVVNYKGQMNNYDEELLSQACTLCLAMAQHCSRFGSTFTSTFSSTFSSGTGGSGGVSGTFTSASIRTIRRAANATLRQIVSMLFDRVSADLVSDNASTRLSSNNQARKLAGSKAASKLFVDLCFLAERHEQSDAGAALLSLRPGNNGEIRGPLLQAIQQTNLQPPPRSMCFELIDMVLSQHKALFSSSPTLLMQNESKADDKDNLSADASISFPTLLRINACPLVTTALLSEYSFWRFSESEDVAERKNSEEPSSLSSDASNYSVVGKNSDEKATTTIEDFSLLVRAIHLAKTIVKCYGQRADIGGECYVLLSALTRFISLVSENHQSRVGFEDTFAYTSYTDESLYQVDENLSHISSVLLWPAALALEVLYVVANDHDLLVALNVSFDSSRPNATIVASLFETLSEFLVISSSNQVIILKLVSYSRQLESSSNDYSPRLFASAKDTTKSYDEWEYDSRKQQKNGQSNANLLVNVSLTSGESLSSAISTPACDEIDMIYAALQTIFSLIQSLAYLTDGEYKTKAQSLVECTSVSSLTVLRHFLKRFSGAQTIVLPSIQSFASLANTILSINNPECPYRKTVVSSLCNIAHVSENRKFSQHYLEDYHVNVLSAVFEVTHSNSEEFSVEDWRWVLETLQQVSGMRISSKKLSDTGYKTATILATSFAHIPIFSSSFSPSSFDRFVQALIMLSGSQANLGDTSAIVTVILDTKSEGREDELDAIHEHNVDSTSKGRLGNRLMNLAGRAIAGVAGAIGSSEKTLPSRAHASKTYCDDLFQETFNILSTSNPATAKSEFDQLSFAIVALTGVTLANSFRLQLFWGDITSHLCALGEDSTSSELKWYALSTIGTLIAAHLSSISDDISTMVKTRKAPSNDEPYFSVDMFPVNREDIDELPPPLSQTQLLSPLCTLLCDTGDPEVSVLGLRSLQTVLESAGYQLTGDAWSLIICTLASLAGAPITDETDVDRTQPEWAECCTTAFKGLHLIINDFLSQLPSPPHESAARTQNALIDCCASFGSSLHDVNVSFTATGMLWTLADQDPSPTCIEVSYLPSVDINLFAYLIHGFCDTSSSTKSHATSVSIFWSLIKRVLSELVSLASNERSEVRNVSVNTIVSLVVGLGSNFSHNQWQICMDNTIFTILDKTSCQIAKEMGNYADHDHQSATEGHSRIFVHHSRDSKEKQWIATQVLIFRGIERIARQFFRRLLFIPASSSDDENDENTNGEHATTDDYMERDMNSDGFLDEEKSEDLEEYTHEESDDSREGDDWSSDTNCDGVSTKGVDSKDSDVTDDKLYYLWIEEAWEKILSTTLTTCISVPGNEVKLAAVDLLVLCVQVSSKSGAVESAVSVGTNMQVVNGALRSVREANDSDDTSQVEASSPGLTRFREALFLMSFERLEQLAESISSMTDRISVGIDEPTFLVLSDESIYQASAKLCNGFSHIYRCCKDNEMCPTTLPSFTEKRVHVEERMIILMETMIMIVFGDSPSRFLSQGQRSCLDLLWTMVEQSSSTRALKSLVNFGKTSFRAVTRTTPGDDDDSIIECLFLSKALANEAARLVANAFQSREIFSSEDKVEAMKSIIDSFRAAFVQLVPRQKEKHGKEDIPEGIAFSDYIVPIICGGIEALSVLESSENKSELRDTAWSSILSAIDNILFPANFLTSSAEIPVAILPAIVNSVPPNHHDRLKTILSDAIFNFSSVLYEDRSPGVVLQLFEASYTNFVILAPESLELLDVSTLCLQTIIHDNRDNPDISKALTEIICNGLNDHIEISKSLIMGVFSHLCQLVLHQNNDIRFAAGKLLGNFDFYKELQKEMQRADEAEKRSAKAEELVMKLELEVKDLMQKNDKLQEEVLALGASSAF